MTTMFDDRETAFEAKFAHDEELKFLALARRDKLFARWAAGQLPLSGTARDTLIHDLLSVQGFPDHDGALLRVAEAALAVAGIGPELVATTLHRFGDEARTHLLQGDAEPIDLSAPG